MALQQVCYDSPEGNVQPGQHVEVINGGTGTILTASQSGAMCIFDTLAGTLFTLPTPVIGMYFNFRFGVGRTSNEHKIVTGTVASEFLKGTISGFTTDVTEVDTFVGNGSTHVSLSMKGGATGGDRGGWIHLVASSTTVWQVTGDLYCTTTAPTDPFDTT